MLKDKNKICLKNDKLEEDKKIKNILEEEI